MNMKRGDPIPMGGESDYKESTVLLMEQKEREYYTPPQHWLHVIDYDLWRVANRRSRFKPGKSDFDIETEQREGWTYD